jgi:hypothetical protein
MVIRKPQKCTVKQVLAAIKNSGGIKTNIARKLHIVRLTLDNYEKKYLSIANAIKDERAQITDKAESNIFVKIQAGDLSVSQWYLKYMSDLNERKNMNLSVNTVIQKNVNVNIDPKIAKKIGDALVAEGEYEIVEEEKQIED